MSPNCQGRNNSMSSSEARCADQPRTCVYLLELGKGTFGHRSRPDQPCLVIPELLTRLSIDIFRPATQVALDGHAKSLYISGRLDWRAIGLSRDLSRQTCYSPSPCSGESSQLCSSASAPHSPPCTSFSPARIPIERFMGRDSSSSSRKCLGEFYVCL